MSDENLWGTIPYMKDIETPMMILRKQAEILERETNGKLAARIHTRWKGKSRDGVGEDKHNDDLKELQIDLVIEAPALDGHFANVVRVIHEMKIFPVTMVNYLVYPFEYIDANNAAEFKSNLSRILRSPELEEEIKEMLIKAKLVE